MRASPLLPSLRRPLVAVLAAATTVLACTQGDLTTGADVPGALLISPVFMIVPDDIESPPIDQIRIIARDATTLEEVGSFDDSVDPTATEWSLDIGIDMGGETSREVVVDVELLSGSNVEWSGRLGPILVTPGITPNVQQVQVYPGPLDNLAVTAVTIIDAPTQLDVGETSTLEAIATVPQGSDVTPVISWISLDPTIIEIQSVSGNQITVEALAAGTVTIGAAAGAQTDAVDVTVSRQPTGRKMWVGGDPAGPTDWFIHENWSPIGVPTIDDDVFVGDVPAGDPVMIASFQIQSLETDAEASIDLGGFSHFVNGGDIVADGPLFNGTVISVEPGPFTVEGLFDALGTNDDRSLSGNLFASIVRVNEDALTVGPNTLNTTGQLRLVSFPGSATLVMDDPNSIVQVGTDFSVQAGDLEGLLTAGRLFVGGDILTSGSRFVATGSHLTTFNGLGPQNIDIGTSSPTGARFQHLTIAGADVTASDDLYVAGDLTVTGVFDIPVGTTVDVAGEVVLQAGASLTVDGTLTAGNGCTDNGATISGSGTSPCVSPLITLTWVGGVGVDPTSVDDPLNWSPQQLPDATTNVVIGVTNDIPTGVSGADYTVASLVVASDGELDLGGGLWTVLGDLDAFGPVYAGDLRVAGPGGILEGSVESLEIAFDRVLSGNLSVSSLLYLDDALLDVGGNSLDVTDLNIQGVNASLGMTDPSDIVNVSGGAIFQGGSHTNRLTAGVLNLEGDLTASGLSAAFVAFGTHQTRFNGTALQNISFSNPGIVGHRFNDVIFENFGPGVAFLTDVYAEGLASIASGSVVDASDDVLGVGGALDDPAGGLSVQTVEVLGDLIDFPGSIATDIIVQSTWNLPGSVDVIGTVTLNNNDLSIGGNTLTVSGDFTITGSGAQLTMDDPNAILDIDGNANFGGSGQTNQLSGGEIQLAGDFTATGSTSAMAADPTHLVTLDGTGNQTINLSSPGIFDQHFFDLTVANFGGTIFFASDVAVEGVFTIPAGAFVDGTGFGLQVAGGYDDGSDGAFLDAVFIEGDLSVMSSVGSGDVWVLADFATQDNFFVGNTLTIEADFNLGSASVTATDIVVQNGGSLIMTDSDGQLNANGNATFSSSTPSFLTAGALTIDGNFDATGSSEAFGASGSHITRFTGLATQTVSFDSPTPTDQRFQDVSFENSFGVEFLSDVVALGTATVTANSLVTATDDVLSVGGALDNQGNLQLQELNIIGNTTTVPITMLWDTRISADFTLPAGWTVNGDLTIDGATATMPGSAVLLNQNFSVANGGIFQMQNGQGTLNVVGNVEFLGANHDGQLTAGILQLLGNFTASGGPLAFVGSGTHEVRFVGSGVQTINFDNPGAFTQRFQDVDIRNFSGSVDFATSATVMGRFDHSDGDIRRSGAGAVLEVLGTLVLDESTIDGLPISLDTNEQPDVHTINLVTFTGMDGADTQLTLRMSGSGQFPSLLADDVTFDQVLTTVATWT
ncbi:MAG: Ig-like domain-containing protein [Gemmatimonadota bacterium]